jgi:phage terminase large subunit
MDLTIPHEWAPRKYQLPLWSFLEGGGKRAAAVWHRRAGKDLFALNWCATASVQRPGVYWHLFPTYNQGRKIAWDGFTKAGRRFIDHIPEQLVSAKNNTEMKLTLKTGGVYQVVGTEDPDRLVGANPVGCIFSEYSLQDPRAWDMIRPILAENEGWAVFIYTARGKNHGWKLLELARKEVALAKKEARPSRWFAEVLTVTDTQAVPAATIEQERADGMPEELIQQEFFCSFEAPVVGAYYAKQMAAAAKEGRITKVPWDPVLQVHTVWDLGVADSCAIIFYQQYGMEKRIIDYYENSGEGLAHYIKKLGEKEYVYGKHTAPWDIEVRELGTGKSRLETARSLGIKFEVLKQSSVEDGIEMARNLLASCWFDEEKCERLIAALREYCKEWDEKLKCFKDRPLHNWTSHPADAFRYLAMGQPRKKKYGDRPPQERAEGDYDVHSS